MAYDEITALLGGWEGFELTGCNGSHRARNDPDRRSCWSCARCLTTRSGAVGAARWSSRSMTSPSAACAICPILEAETWLVFPRARLHARAVARPSKRCRGSIAINA